MPAGGSTHMSYRPDIDGRCPGCNALPRAVWPHSQGASLALMFSVISGFLIASIIEHDLARAQFTFMGFYERRVRRIFPALLGVVGPAF
jgi:peptidoglycan/LPS O-acetylase OafA/YrhL